MKIIKVVLFSILSLIIIFLFFLFFFLPKIKQKAGVELKVAKIKEEFNGVILDKYSVRNTAPTHLRISTNLDTISISPNLEITRNCNIGDSIFKPKNENYLILKDLQGNKKTFFYTKLSYETRNSKFFPKEWRKKWPESSDWDK